MLLILLNGLKTVGKIVNNLIKIKEDNKMDYIVEYSVDGEIKEEIITFEDFISDFIEDFILDKLYDLEECENIEILHIESLRDYNVDVYNL